MERLVEECAALPRPQLRLQQPCLRLLRTGVPDSLAACALVCLFHQLTTSIERACSCKCDIEGAHRHN